jgi:hypothetical protein
MKKTILIFVTIISISSCAYVGFGIGIPLNGNAKEIIDNTKITKIQNIKNRINLKKNS